MEWKSVIIYLIAFMSTIGMTFIAENLFANTNKKKSASYILAMAFSGVALLIPCTLAAMRNISVGKDVMGYVYPNYIVAIKSSSFGEFLLLEYPKTEILFSVLLYWGGKLKNIGYIFFSIELLILLPLYYVLYKRRKEASMTLGMMIFLFLFYNFGLSGMRQSIAMSFILLAYYYFSINERFRAIFWCIVAILFHTVALLVIPIYLFSLWIYQKPIRKRKKWYMAIATVFVLIFLFYRQIAGILARIVGIISGRYSYYISRYLQEYSGVTLGNIHSTDLLCKSALILFFAVVFKCAHKYDDKAKYMVYLMLIGRYFVVFNAVFYESLRIAYFFDYFLIVFIPCMMNCVKRDLLNKIVFSVGLFIPVFLYWFYFIMKIGGYVTNIYFIR